MKIVYWSTPSYLDLSLMFIRALSRHAEVHFLLEITPESRKSNILDISGKKLPEGISDAEPLLEDCFPESVRHYWEDCASFSLLVHNCGKSIHPSSWITSRKGAEYISGIDPDVIHLDDISLRQSWSLHKLKHFPIALSIHDPEPHTGEKNWRRDLARRIAFPKAAKFILHNSRQASSFTRNYSLAKEKVCAVPLGSYGIFLEWSEGKTTESDRTILFFGRISPYKGIESLFRASTVIAEKVHGVRIVVAGRPIPGYTLPEPPELPNGGAIEIMNGYISNTDMAALFEGSSVVVCPYIDATQSGVVLASYAFNKPVVATDTGGMSEYVKHMKTGLLVPPRDDAQLADALIRLLSDSELRTKLIAGISDMADKELSWDSIALQSMDIYKTLCS